MCWADLVAWGCPEQAIAFANEFLTPQRKRETASFLAPRWLFPASFVQTTCDQLDSDTVEQPTDGLLLSNAIRPGVIGLAKSLSIELAPDNITINNVCPGRILTDRILEGLNVREKLAKGMSVAEAISGQEKDIPLGRLGNPEELGALVAFLASAQASYITGTTILVDGGLVRSVL